MNFLETKIECEKEAIDSGAVDTAHGLCMLPGELRDYTNKVIELCALELEQHLDGSDARDDTVNDYICSSAEVVRNLKLEII
jgi:hypothetical protein